MIKTLKPVNNIIPLGKLDYGIYPKRTAEPITYLYYRPNGDLMMYRTVDETEINLKDLSAYQNVTYFKTQEDDSLEGTRCEHGHTLNASHFESRTIEANKTLYKRRFSSILHQHIFILVPAVYKLHSIFQNGEAITNLFSFTGVYELNGFYYYSYRSRNKFSLNGEIELNIVYQFMTYEELSPFIAHIADYEDPHNTLAYLLNKHAFSSVFWREGDNLESTVDLHIVRGTEEQIRATPLRDRQMLIDISNLAIAIDTNGQRQWFTRGDNADDRVVKSNTVDYMETVDELPDELENNTLYIVMQEAPEPGPEGISVWAINDDFVVGARKAV